MTICPGLAITLVDARERSTRAAGCGEDEVVVTIPFEFGREALKKGDLVTVMDTAGDVLGEVRVVRTLMGKATDRTMIVQVRAPRVIARRIAGILVQEPDVSASLEQYTERLQDDMIVCRCERVTLGEIKEVIRSGSRDLNEIKALTRAGMGACGGKTCQTLIIRAFRELDIPLDEVTPHVQRPLFVEVPLGVLAGVSEGGAGPASLREPLRDSRRYERDYF